MFLWRGFLGEAHRADIQAKLLVSLTDVQGRQVHHGQPGGGLRPVLQHGPAPLSIWFLRKRVHTSEEVLFPPFAKSGGFVATHRAAVLEDGVAEPGVALRSQLLAVGASEDQGFLQAAHLIFVGHAVPAVEGDVLVRLLGQELQQLQLDGHCVGLLLMVAVEELEGDMRVEGSLQSFRVVTRRVWNQMRVLLWFHCSCQLRTTQACCRRDWTLSTRTFWGCWLDWQRCRFHRCPCYRRP